MPLSNFALYIGLNIAVQEQISIQNQSIRLFGRALVRPIGSIVAVWFGKFLRGRRDSSSGGQCII